MGLLSKIVKELPKVEVPFTDIELHIVDIDKSTYVSLLNPIYSEKGRVTKVWDIPTVSTPEGYELYKDLMLGCVRTSMKIRKILVENNIE